MKKAIATVFFLIVTNYGFATPIALTSAWQFNKPEPEGFLGQLTFIYEDSTPDDNPADWSGIYTNALTLFTLSYGDTIWTAVPGVDNTISTSANNHGYTALGINATVANNFGKTYLLQLGVEIFPVRTDDTLVNLAAQVLPYNNEESHLFFKSEAAGPILFGGIMRGGFTQVPEPSLGALICAGILAMALMRKNQRKFE